MTSTRGEKELRTDWPVVEGHTFGTTRTHKKCINLVPTRKSLIRRRAKKGI